MGLRSMRIVILSSVTMANSTRLSLGIADLPLTPFGMRSPVSDSTNHIPGTSNKLSRKHLKSPNGAKEVNSIYPKLPSNITESNKENSRSQAAVKKLTYQHWNHLRNNYNASTGNTQSRYNFSNRIHTNLPALIEEDSTDAFVVPQIPKKFTPKQKKTPVDNSRRDVLPPSSSSDQPTPPSGSVLHKPLQERFFDNTQISSINPVRFNNVLCSTQIGGDRRESVMTDIDDGSFVEFTSQIPEGRVVPHIDSVEKLKENLYFTCTSQPNETKYSTSTKTAQADYGFHQLVDAVKNKMLKENNERSDAMGLKKLNENTKDKEENGKLLVENEAAISGSQDVMMGLAMIHDKVLNSTMVGGKRQSQFHLSIPDVSTLSLITELQEFPLVPVYSNNKEYQPKNLSLDIEHRKLIKSAHKGMQYSNKENKNPETEFEDPVNDSLISEDVSLACTTKSPARHTTSPSINTKNNNVVISESSSEDSGGNILRGGSDLVDISASDEATSEASSICEVPGSPPESRMVVIATQKQLTKLIRPVPVFTPDAKKVNSPDINTINKPSNPVVINGTNSSPHFHVRQDGSAGINKLHSPFHQIIKTVPRKVNSPYFQNVNKPATTTIDKKLRTPVFIHSPHKQVNLLPNEESAMTPITVKPSVCHWVVSSPFNDGSFDCSFLRHGSTSSSSNNIVNAMVFETSEDSSECESSSNGTPNKITINDIIQPKENVNLKKKKNVNSKGSVSDSLISEGASLKLRVSDGNDEASCDTGKTVMTIGRIAKSPPVYTTKPTKVLEREIKENMGENLETLKSKEISKTCKKTNVKGNVKTQKKLLHTELDDSLPDVVSPVKQITKRKPKQVNTNKEEKDVMPTSKNHGNVERELDQIYGTSWRAKKSLVFSATKTNVKKISSSTIINNKKIVKSPKQPLNNKPVFNINMNRVNKKLDKGNDSSSDEDGLSSYMYRWRQRRDNLLLTSDESDIDKFINDECIDSDSEGECSPSDNILNPIKKGVNKHEKGGSVSDVFLKKRTPKLKGTEHPAFNKEPIVLSSSSEEEIVTPRHRLFHSNEQVVLVDSDSDEYVAITHRKPPLTLPTFHTPKPPQRKTLVCPKTAGPAQRGAAKVTSKSNVFSHGTPTLSFTNSLSLHCGNDRLHPEAAQFTNNFTKTREQLVSRLYALYNKNVFEDNLPKDMKVTWNVHMTTTAGFCYNQIDRSKENGRGSRIELSVKVVDNCERVRDTLIHEMCHAATWILSATSKGHGPLWKAWMNMSRRAFPELPIVSRCHHYTIASKYTYKCTKCNYSISRHSKSLDRKVCGKCKGEFELIVNKKQSAGAGTVSVPTTPKTPGPFALFVKENFGTVKKSHSSLKHGDIMRILGEQFKQMKT